MRILVLTGIGADRMAAHALNTLNMAQGFAQLGHDVTIISYPAQNSRVTLAELESMYGLSTRLNWIQLARPKFRSQPLSAHYPFALLAMLHVLRLRPDFVFARNYIAPYLTARFGYPTAAESHAHLDNQTPSFLRMITAARDYPQFRALVTIGEVLRDHYQSLGVPENKLLILPTGVDIERFLRPAILPVNPYQSSAPNVAYVGHLYDYKGIPTIFEAAQQLPAVNFHLVGGKPDDIERHRQTIEQLRLNNVSLHGLKPQQEVPPYLWYADVLLLPPSAHHPSAEWTSPVKLGEYLASGSPVIATDIPALRSWLTDKQVTFIPPDSGQAMASAIQHILSQPDTLQQQLKNGLELAHSFSYANRARTILQHCRLI